MSRAQSRRPQNRTQSRTYTSTSQTSSRAHARASYNGAPQMRTNASATGRNAGRSGGRGDGRSGGSGYRAPKRGGGFKRFLKYASIFMALVVLGVAVVGALVINDLQKTLPDLDIRNAKGRDQTSVITDRNGKVLSTLFAEQNREDVKLDQMPQQLRQAVIATEDKRFYEHDGVDPIGIARALVVDIIKGSKAQGGSTITQQYVKQAFVGSQKTAKRKVQEALMARELDKKYSKDEILELYLNTIYFGHGSYGVQSAAHTYYGKDVSKLDLSECATLAGIIKSPGNYSPYLEPENAVTRRNVVLMLMKNQSIITDAEYQAAKAEEIKTAGLKQSSVKAPYFVEWIKKQLIDTYGESRVYRGGLTIKTTLDYAMQRDAEKTAKNVLNQKGDPDASIVSVDPKTGEVLVMVGGKNFKKQQFNVATQGKRQPGSAFKTFVLASALEQGISPEKVYETKARSFQVGDGVWKVTGSTSGPQTLRNSTIRSINSVFAELILEISPEKVVDTASRMGITEKINPVPAIALGGLTTGVSPLEMASAYGTLANGGTAAKPYGILEVKDKDGKVLKTGAPSLTKDAIAPEVAYLTTDVLRGVIKSGTGTAAQIGRPAAGKTGTTQVYRDAWFCGYTPDLATAVWVGYPDSQKEMTSVHGITVTGGSFPAQIWGTFMKAALADTPASSFKRPAGMVKVEICDETDKRANEYCPSTHYVYTTSSKDLSTCTLHKPEPAKPSKETSVTEGLTEK